MSKKLTTEEFIERAKVVHGNTYDYSKTVYINHRTKVNITCPKHGEFFIGPFRHLIGQGCKKCWQENRGKIRTLPNENFIERSKAVHGDKYDYSKSQYNGGRKKVCIICPTHGEFWQQAYHHMKGHGCPKCADIENGLRKFKGLEQFITEAKLVHGNKYDYSKIEYKGCYEKVCIICPKHGEFWQRPYCHLQGQRCPICGESKLEEKINVLFNDLSINSERQKHFKWLCKQSLDFYVPHYNIAIECQGIQHFESVDFFGGKKHLEYIQQLDTRKKQLCEEHGVKLYYINYNDDVETKLKEILKENGFDKVS